MRYKTSAPTAVSTEIPFKKSEKFFKRFIKYFF